MAHVPCSDNKIPPSPLFKWMAFGCLFLIAAFISGCAGQTPEEKKPAFEQVGLASYYAEKFHGRRTASGERYDRQALTAAHPTLPFDTMVTVKNTRNNRSVTVRINDRGPHIKGRIIDLSYAAARQLGMIRNGVVRVRITIAP